jgi:hypothetical protein
MGADCIANNLHFHVIYADQMMGGGVVEPDNSEVLPIELANKKLFYRTSLQHKDKEEINMYNCAVRFGELTDWPLRTLILSPDLDSNIGGEETSLEDA